MYTSLVPRPHLTGPGNEAIYVYTFAGQGAISQNLNDACNKTLCLALEYIKNCSSGPLFVALGCLDGQILVQRFTVWPRMHNCSYTIQFLLWVSLFSCSVFGSCSLVLCNHFAVSKLEPMTAPHYVSRNLKREGSGELCVQAVSHWNAISWMM